MCPADEIPRGRRVLLELLQREPEVETERDQPLLRAVVEIALDPPPFLDRRVDRAGPGLFERPDPLVAARPPQQLQQAAVDEGQPVDDVRREQRQGEPDRR